MWFSYDLVTGGKSDNNHDAASCFIPYLQLLEAFLWRTCTCQHKRAGGRKQKDPNLNATSRLLPIYRLRPSCVSDRTAASVDVILTSGACNPAGEASSGGFQPLQTRGGSPAKGRRPSSLQQGVLIKQWSSALWEMSEMLMITQEEIKALEL